MNRKEGLDDLATRISALVNEQPNEGPEQSMVVMVRGDNHGNVTFGNHITINTAAETQIEERPLTDNELYSLEQDAKRRYRQAWWRSRLNVPSIIILGILFGMTLWALFMGIHLIKEGSFPEIFPSNAFPLVMLGIGAVLIPMMRWADRIKRLEQPILNEARGQIELAQQTLHRRRVM